MVTQLLLLAAFVFVMLLMSFNYTKRRKKIIFFGDFITEQGVWPGGYVSTILSYINSEGLADKYDLVGAGISGDTVDDLLNRLVKDVLSKGANIVVIFIGVNDVWHASGRGIDIVHFEHIYRQVIYKLRADGISLILCTPAVIGEKSKPANPLDGEMDVVCDLIKNLAATHDLKLVDLRNAFLEYYQANNVENMAYGVLTTDGVHLNEKGNELVAKEIWKVIKE